jgi:NADH dehydrogenase
MARISPVLPVIAPETRFQPAFVDDVATAAARAVTEDVAAGVYELGGPEVKTFRELIDRILEEIRRRRLVLTMPMAVARLQASLLDAVQRLSGGLLTNSVLTRDQLLLLGSDNVATPGAKGFAELGIAPTAMDAVLDSYLYVYRPSGQYDEIKESAVRMRS